jgi:hypothetical protein
MNTGYFIAKKPLRRIPQNDVPGGYVLKEKTLDGASERICFSYGAGGK